MITNIGKSKDPFYRYKRPISIVDNNKTKTTIVNLNHISQALHTKPEYIMYYIQLKKSLPTNQNGMIKGSLSQVEIEKILDEYTETYILYQECKFPELIIDRNGQKLFYVCQACGKHLEIPHDKFTKLIYSKY